MLNNNTGINRLIVTMIMLVLLSGFVVADKQDNTLFAYEFQEGSGITSKDSSGNEGNITLYNNVSWVSQSDWGDVNMSVDFDGSNQYARTTDDIDISKLKSLCIIMKLDSWDGSNKEKIIATTETAGNYVLLDENGNNLRIIWTDTNSVKVLESSTAMNTQMSSPYMACVIRRGDKLELWINDTMDNNLTDATLTDLVGRGNLTVFARATELPSYYADGQVLTIIGFNDSLSGSEVSELYYNKTLYSGWGEATINQKPDANWEYQEPVSLLTTNQNNLTFYFNFSDDYYASSNATCILFEDSVPKDNETFTNDGIKNLTVMNISEGQHNYIINCTDYFGLSDTTSTKLIETDYTDPILNVFSPAIDNSTVFYTSLNVSFYIEDTNLARYTVNVTNSTGALIYNSLVNVTPTNHTIELILNTTLWNDGVFDVQIGIADE